MNTPVQKPFNTRKYATIAILAAVASILYVLEIPIVLFYRLDFSNLPVLLGTFSMGPVAGTTILAIKSLLGLTHTTSLGVGELADFLTGFAMLFPAGLMYRMNKSRKGAVVGMAIGAASATLVGVMANVWILIPFYGSAFHMPVEQILAMGQSVVPSIHTVWEFVLVITAPFNVLKWVVISVVGGIMYKPLSPILHGYRRSRPTERAR